MITRKNKEGMYDQERLFVLDVDGKLHCDELSDSRGSGLPLTGSAYIQMAQDTLSLNKDSAL